MIEMQQKVWSALAWHIGSHIQLKTDFSHTSIFPAHICYKIKYGKLRLKEKTLHKCINLKNKNKALKQSSNHILAFLSELHRNCYFK